MASASLVPHACDHRGIDDLREDWFLASLHNQLRLQEARRLMLSEDLDAAEAGYRVGYDDASYFSREYKRYFGAPPVHDVERL